jgi:hypothetical protein
LLLQVVAVQVLIQAAVAAVVDFVAQSLQLAVVVL